MTMNGAVPPILALYIVAEEQGVDKESFEATFKMTSSRSSWFATPTFIHQSLYLLSFDICVHRCRDAKMTISISGYHMQEIGATADFELAYTLADGLAYVRSGLAAGLDITTWFTAVILLGMEWTPLSRSPSQG